MHSISDIPISKKDYWEMVNASLKGGLTGKAKTIVIGFKTIRHKRKKKQV
jgi:hypothetical protein